MNKKTQLLAALPAVLPRNPMLIPNGTRTELEVHDMLPELAFPMLRKGYRLGGQRALAICKLIEDVIADVTFFGLAVQNVQNRPEWQIDALMEGALLFVDKAMQRGYALHPFGHVDVFRDVPKYQPLYRRLDMVRSGEYKPSKKLTVHVAVNYSGVGKYELGPLIRAVRTYGLDKVGLDPMQYILSAGVPDSDLVVRTGGECRLSGFCPLQTAYAELRFVNISWMKYTTDRFIADLHWFAEQKPNHGK